MINFTSLKSWMLAAALCFAGSAMAQTELLQNAGFEEWNGGDPAHWVSTTTAGNATLSQSSDARTGSSSVMVKGASSNKRLAYEEMTLSPGTYTFSIYAKAATEENASARPGYAPVNDDNSMGPYVYGEYVNDITNAEWVQVAYTFTLEAETKVNLVVMNPKLPGKDLLLDDASLTTEDGGIVDEPVEPEPEPTPSIFEETFGESLGAFTIDNVVPAEGLEGEVWTFDSRYGAKATSYANGQNYPTESWLISPSIDLTAVKSAVLTFDHACNYFNDVTTDLTLWVREGADGEWAKLEIPTYPNSWTFVSSGEIDLAAYVGKTVQIGFKYVCTEKAGTYELKNFVVAEKSGEEPEEPEVPENESSKENPYTVAQALAAYNAEVATPGVWVKGYIVGYVDGQSLESGAVFGAEAPEGGTVSATNLLIADKADVTDYTQCLIVQLTAGNIREALNLQDHPENLGKEVVLAGSLETYFKTCGLKSPTDYILEGVEPEPVPMIDFVKATEVVSGKRYVLAVLNDELSIVAQNLTESAGYGYLYTSPVTVEDGKLAAAENNAFTFTATDGGYTIQDSYGRYVYMTGTFNSLNVSAELPESGHVWTVAFDADGAATITNVEMSKWIQYSSGYSSFGSYPAAQDGGILPYLYVESDGSSIAEVNAADEDAPVEVYTLSGVKVGNSLDDVRGGSIYIVKKGNVVKKVLK